LYFLRKAVNVKENGDVLIPKLLGNGFIRQNRSSRLDLRSNGILAVLFYKVDMRNIYSSDSTCSDKPLNIRSKTKL